MGKAINKTLCTGAGKKLVNKFLTELSAKEDGNTMQEMSADELTQQDINDDEVYEWINSSEFSNLDVSSCMNESDLLNLVGGKIIAKFGQTAYDNIQCSVLQFERVEATEDDQGHVIAKMEFNSKFNSNSATVDFDTYWPTVTEQALQAAIDALRDKYYGNPTMLRPNEAYDENIMRMEIGAVLDRIKTQYNMKRDITIEVLTYNRTEPTQTTEGLIRSTVVLRVSDGLWNISSPPFSFEIRIDCIR